MAVPEYSNINLTMKKRLIFLFTMILALMITLVGRVGYLQLIKGPELQAKAVEQWTNDVKLDAKRGKILDRNGIEFAVSASSERVDAYIRDIVDAEKENKNIRREIAQKLSEILDVSEESIFEKVNKNFLTVAIKRRIDKDQADAIRSLNLPGIVVSEDTKRYYPHNNLLSHVIGFTDSDGNGQEGLEKKYNDVLKGTQGRIIMEANPDVRETSYNISKYIAPVNGNDIVLTIDKNIQVFVEKAIEDALVETKAKAVTAIVMDPKTGEILAMANKPDYNLNNPRDMKDFTSFEEVMSLWNNRAVTFTYEPGSIFKVVTATAALSEGVVSDNDRFTCSGYKIVAGRRIKCWRTKGHGTQTFAEILQNSCNVGFMELGEKLGKEKLYKYIDAFGFGNPTGIDVNFEESGVKRVISKIGPVELSNLSFGQGISVTPMQMITTFATIANDGKMVEPHLVKRIQKTDQDGNVTVVKTIEPKIKRQVIDEETARKLRSYLELVVSIGGGKKAYVEGYHIGGKTGTAQKAEGGTYARGKYVASFLGMAPADNPEIVLFLCIDEPDPSNYYAGQIAAPVAGRIFKDIFTYLDMPSDNDGQDAAEVILPNVVKLTRNEAYKKLKEIGMNVEIKGNGSVVTDMNPKPGLTVNEGSKVILYTGNGENYNSKVIVPNLLYMSEEEADDVLSSLGLKLKKSGEGYAIDQYPEVGEEVTIGSKIDVEFEILGD